MSLPCYAYALKYQFPSRLSMPAHAKIVQICGGNDYVLE